MVGCRILVGATLAPNVPSSITVFDRTLSLEEGGRRWYELPFTTSEALKADKDFTLTVGPTLGGACPRLDSLDVYARTKEEFGWRKRVPAEGGVEARGGRRGVGSRGGEGTPAQRTLLCALHSLRLLYAAQGGLAQGGESEGARVERLGMLEEILEGQGDGGVEGAARGVLRALCKDEKEYFEVSPPPGRMRGRWHLPVH